MIYVWKNNNDYEEFVINLNIHGCARFEHHTVSHIIEDYVIKYNTKECLNSDN